MKELDRLLKKVEEAEELANKIKRGEAHLKGYKYNKVRGVYTRT